MGAKRVILRGWIAEQGHDPAHPAELREPFETAPTVWPPEPETRTDARTEKVRRAVRMALGTLTRAERDFIQRFYFKGETYEDMQERTGRGFSTLEIIHKRAIRKLRRCLTPFVKRHYGVRGRAGRGCPICRSPHRNQIDRIIRDRRRNSAWKPIIAILRDRYGISIRSPQTLIGHEKYH